MAAVDREPEDAEVVEAEAGPRAESGAPADGVAPEPSEAGLDAESEPTEEEVELDELTAARAERDRYLELAQRTQAELENLRKRAARDASEAERRGRGALARALAPAIDNLERALLASGVEPDRSTEPSPDGPPSEEVSARRALAEGVALVYRELSVALEGAGVSSFDPTGEEFDPTHHEAVQTLAAGEENTGKVVETLARGYRIDEQVLRAASVVVGE